MSHRVITDQVGVRFGLGNGVLFALTAVVVAVGLRGAPGVAVLFLATVVLATALDAPHAVLLGLAGWAFATGFAVNTLGVLTTAPPDQVRLAAFVVAAVGTGRLGGTG
jgi:hypothetical protein